MNCLKLIRPRSFSRTFKIATIIAFVIFMCIQLGSYYRSYHEKKLKILQKYSDRVQDEKDKEYLARKPVVNSDEVEGVSYVLEAYLYQNIILIICNFLDEGKCSIKALVG